MWNAYTDNEPRFLPQDARGHVESYFVKLNEPSGRRALWVRHTIFSPRGLPREALAELWAIAFDRQTGAHVAVKRSWSYRDPLIEMQSLPLRLDRSTFGPGEVRGELEKSGRALSWDLSFTSGAPSMHLLQEPLYKAPLPRSKTLTPYPDARFSGSYTVNGETVSVDNWPGMQGHNWGRENAYLYAWSHANTLCDERGEPLPDTYFEGISARVKAAGLLTPFLSAGWLRLRGVDIPFTSIAALWMARSEVKSSGPYEWRFTMQSENGQLEGSLDAPRGDFVGLYYPNPDGTMTHCLNTKLARFSLRFTPRHGSSVLLSSVSAALEIGTRDPHHGIAMAL